MKKGIILLVLFVFTRCFAQNLLTPTSYGIYDWSGYTESVFQTLLPNIGKRDVLREGSFKTFYLCAPAFTGEYALSVEKSCLILTRAEKNIWCLLEYGESVFYGNNAAKNKSRQHTSKKEGKKNIAVDKFVLNVPASVCDQLEILFKHAITTASHLQPKYLGYDGATYYFNFFGNLAEVWMPSVGRTKRLVQMADSICYAVEHSDMSILNRQMIICKELTLEFKHEYSISYFTPEASTFSGVKEGGNGEDSWMCRLSSRKLYLSKEYDHPVYKDTLDLFLQHYGDSLASWSQEIFFIDEFADYWVIFTDSDTAKFFYNDEYHAFVLYLPERLWRRDIILSVLSLTPGNYRLDADLRWRRME